MRALTLIFAALTAATLMTISSGNANACPATQYFAVGGNTDTQSAWVPGTPHNAIRIHYSANVFDGDRSRAEGKRNLERAVNDFRNQCPHSRVELRGVSLGASVVSMVTDQWIGTPKAHNINAVLYGNPRRPLTPNGYGGIEAAGLPHIPGVYTWLGPRKRAHWVHDVCNLGRDIICDAPVPLHKNLDHAWRGLEGYLGSGHHY